MLHGALPAEPGEDRVNFRKALAEIFSAAGLILSLALHLGWCPGSGCGKPFYVLGVPVALWGSVFYAASGMCFAFGRKLALRLLLSTGLAAHGWLLHLMVTSGEKCSGCLVAFGLTVALCVLVASESGLLRAGAVALLGGLIVAVVWLNPGSYQEIQPTRTLAAGAVAGWHDGRLPQDLSEAAHQHSATPKTAGDHLLRVLRADGSEVVLDLRKRPALFFAPWCSHCTEVLEKVSEMPPERRPYLVSVYLRGDWFQGVRDTQAKLSSCGLPADAAYYGFMEPERVPAVVWWDGRAQVTVGGEKRVLEFI